MHNRPLTRIIIILPSHDRPILLRAAEPLLVRVDRLPFLRTREPAASQTKGLGQSSSRSRRVEEGDRGAGERGRGKHEPMIVKVVLFLARASTDGMSVADWTVCVGPVVVTDVALESANYKSSAKFEAARARRVDRKKDARRT
jgi:hypothetical protein